MKKISTTNILTKIFKKKPLKKVKKPGSKPVVKVIKKSKVKKVKKNILLKKNKKKKYEKYFNENL